jgi:hypothetical protein
LGRHYLDYDHKELPIFVLKSHLVAFSDGVFQGSRDATGWWHPPSIDVANVSRLLNSGYWTMRHLSRLVQFRVLS